MRVDGREARCGQVPRFPSGAWCHPHPVPFDPTMGAVPERGIEMGPIVWVSAVLMPAFVLCGALGFWMAFDGAQWATPGWYRRTTRR